MILANRTWQEVDAFSRDGVIVLPTGSLEQHGPHLPLITDSLIVSAVAEAVEKRLPQRIALLPTVWLGASAHHLSYAGSASATFASYVATVKATIESYQRSRFRKFVLLNGHGGNVEPNRMALRELKDSHPNGVFVGLSYFDLIEEEIAGALEGPHKQMSHACEAETSLIMHLKPDLVRIDKIHNDGMQPDPPIRGAILDFRELSDEGAIGFPTFAKAETGARLFEAAVQACALQLQRISETFVLVEI